MRKGWDPVPSCPSHRRGLQWFLTILVVWGRGYPLPLGKMWMVEQNAAGGDLGFKHALTATG